MTAPLTVLRVAADLQAAAYKTWGNDPDAFSAGNVQAKRYRIGDYTYIAIRGTDELRDWVDNVPVPMVTSACTVNEGYIHHAVSLHGWIVSEEVHGKGLVLCGHSLGGAVAITLPLISPTIRQRLAHIVTFGSPKCTIGPYPFADKVTRVVRRLDVVPHLPAWGDWSHVGTELYFTDDGLPADGSQGYRVVGDGVFTLSVRRCWRFWNKINQWHSCEGYSVCRFGGGE